MRTFTTTFLIGIYGLIYSQMPELSSYYSASEQLATPTILDRLSEERARGEMNGWTFQVGYTSVFDLPLSEITGRGRAHIGQDTFEMVDIDLVADISSKLALDKLLLWVNSKSMDMRKRNIVTPVRFQGVCASNWAFASIAAIETSVLVRDKSDPNNLDLSEQYLIDCSGAGNCGSGSLLSAYQFAQLPNTMMEESRYPYIHQQKSCTQKPPPSEIKYAVNGIYMVSGKFEANKSAQRIQKIKAAICYYGSVTATMDVNEEFKMYAGGVFNCDEQEAIGKEYHMIQIIGWDDDKRAWLIKNSWGKNWGEDGFAWVDYHTLRIGAYCTAIDICPIMPNYNLNNEHKTAYYNGIDAAIFIDGHSYLFKGNEYFRFTQNKLDEKFPKYIKFLPGIFKNGIDAALYYPPNGKIYLFKDNLYVRLSIDNVQGGLSLDDDYPKDLPGGWYGLPKHFALGINAAIYENGYTYFFKQDEYVRFQGTRLDYGYPKALPGGWSIPNLFHTTIDGALDTPLENTSYLFKGSKIIEMDGTKMRDTTEVEIREVFKIN